MFTRLKGSRRVSNALTTSSTSSSMNCPSETTTISTYRDSHDELSQTHPKTRVDVMDDLYDFFTDDATHDDLLAIENTEKQHRKRQTFIEQLLEFETDYCNRLHSTLLYFKQPISLHYLRSSSSCHDSNAGIQHHNSNISSTLLSPFLSKQSSSTLSSLSHVNINIHDIDILFGSIESLYKLHETFLENLSQRFQIWSSLQLVSDVLQPLLNDIMSVYNDYFENYPKMMAILEIIGKSRDGTKLTEAVVPSGVGRVDLLSLLELPLYTIAKYNQLITEITKLTDFNHPDFGQLKLCQHQIQNIDLQMTSRIKICQNISQLMDMSLTVMGGPLMMDQPRQFIKSGKLYYEEGKSVHDLRICFLTSDQLITAKSIVSGQHLQFKGKVDLKNATIKTITTGFVITENATVEDASHQHADTIDLLLNASGTTPPRQHYFKIEKDNNDHDLQSWVCQLQNVIQALRQRK